MSKLKSAWLAAVRNKWFCLAWLAFGFAYVTVYGMLYVEDLYTEGLQSVNLFGILFEPTMTATASIIGKTYFWAFKGWGIFQSVSLALGTLHMYRRYGFEGSSAKAGKICLVLGACCIAACVLIPSTEEFGLQLVAHWSGALLFGVFNAVAIGLCLLRLSKQSRKFLVSFIAFLAMLAAMIVLLIAFGKSGAIENIPMWGAYLILFAAGYTGLYQESLPAHA